jgi:hypothetical protein
MKMVRKPVRTTIKVEPGAANADQAPEPNVCAWQSTNVVVELMKPLPCGIAEQVSIMRPP